MSDDAITGEQIFTLRDFGLDLVVIGMAIMLVGVMVNNVLLDHILAMKIWVPSNAIFALYFFGRYRDWWDGHISDGLMCVTYVITLASGIWGLTQ